MRRKTFLGQPLPILSAIMAGQTPQQLIAECRNAHSMGAQAITISLHDLKPEYRNEEALRQIFQSVPLPFMVYFYRNDAWENRDDDARQQLLLTAAEAGAAMIDVMGDLYDPSPLEITRNPEAIERQKCLIREIHARGAEVVISSHHPTQAADTRQVLEHLNALAERGADVVKIVTGANSPDELAEAFRTTMTLKRELKVPFIHLTVGTHSRPHRLLCPALGTAICFAVTGYEPRYNMPQPTLSDMRTAMEITRWNISDYLPHL